MVRPPPGVSVGVTSAAHRLDQSAGEREAEAEPVPVPVSPSRWNGWNTWSCAAAGIPGPRSMTCSTHSVAVPASTRTTGGSPRWREPLRVGHEVDDHPLEQPGVDHDVRKPLLDVEHDRRAARRRGRRAPGHARPRRGRTRVDRQRTGLQPAHVEQVVDQAGEPVERTVGGLEQLAPIGRSRWVDVLGAQPGDDGLRRRQRRAQVVADGGQERGPQPVRGLDLGGRRGRAARRSARSTTQLTITATSTNAHQRDDVVRIVDRERVVGPGEEEVEQTAPRRGRDQGGSEATDQRGQPRRGPGRPPRRWRG